MSHCALFINHGFLSLGFPLKSVPVLSCSVSLEKMEPILEKLPFLVGPPKKMEKMRHLTTESIDVTLRPIHQPWVSFSWFPIKVSPSTQLFSEPGKNGTLFGEASIFSGATKKVGNNAPLNN